MSLRRIFTSAGFYRNLSSIMCPGNNSFLYFAYGSNLLTKRIHINNPSAKKLDIGLLENYKLDFNNFSQRWKGASATIVENENSHVWGVLWEINETDKPNLDKQEGVDNGIYKPISVKVKTSSGEMVEARSYQLLKMDEKDTRPSFVYLDVIIRGAKENGIPENYVEFLEAIEHNGYKGEVNLKLDLD